MPSRPHPCAHPDCTAMLPRKEAVHCRKHCVKTPEHQAKIAAALKGRVFTAEHRARLSLSKRGPGAIQRECDWCGDVFGVRKPSSEKMTCSIECRYARVSGENSPNWRHDMPIINCGECGTPVRQSAFGFVRVFCSHSCNAKVQMRRQKTANTNIERIVAAEFEARGWPYEQQVRFGKRAVADFLLPQASLIVFCDGDYWHSRDGVRFTDVRVTAYLETLGYGVLRFAGSDIEAFPTVCADVVSSALALRTSGTLAATVA